MHTKAGKPFYPVPEEVHVAKRWPNPKRTRPLEMVCGEKVDHETLRSGRVDWVGIDGEIYDERESLDPEISDRGRTVAEQIAIVTCPTCRLYCATLDADGQPPTQLPQRQVN